MGTEDLTLVLQGIASIVTIILFVAAYLGIKKYHLEGQVDKVVKAAEILFNLPKDGEAKKKWAEEKIFALTKGKIPKDWLDILIEAAVEELHLQQAKTTTPAIATSTKKTIKTDSKIKDETVKKE